MITKEMPKKIKIPVMSFYTQLKHNVDHFFKREVLDDVSMGLEP